MNSIYASLEAPDKYLFALYALFDIKGPQSTRVCGIIEELTGGQSLHLKATTNKLHGMGLIEPTLYNWRNETYDYTVTDSHQIPAMIHLFQKEPAVAIDVLNAGKELRPSSVQKLLWRFISTDFHDIALEELDNNIITNELPLFAPALLDNRFAPLVMLFSEDCFFTLFNIRMTAVMEQEELFDTTYLRSLVNSYNGGASFDNKTRCLCLLDLYDYLAYGRMAERLLPANRNHRIIAAIHEAYHGHFNKAFDHFRKSLQLQNKDFTTGTLKKNHFILPLLNWFYVLTAYLTGDDDARKKVLPLGKATESGENLTAATLHSILNRTTGDKQTRESLATLLAADSRTVRTIATLMCHYMGKELSNEQPARWLVMKHEMRRYRPLNTTDAIIADRTYGHDGLLASIYRKQEWESVLDELMGKGSSGNQQAERNTRIAYFISSTDDDTVQVKQQTTLKSGRWGAGKTISPWAFLEGKAEGVTPTDQRIIHEMNKLSVYDLTLPLEAVLPEMVEDSRLYVGRYAPYTLVEVTEEMPYITLLRGNDGFIVSSNVPLDSVDSEVIITHRGAASLSFLRLTDLQRTYYSRLLSLGRFPLEAEEQLREFLKGIGGKIEVNSDLIEGGSTLPLTDGNAQLVIQMRPHDKDTYVVNLFTRPLEGGGMRCRPGIGNEIVVDQSETTGRTRVRRDLDMEREHLYAFCDATGLRKDTWDTFTVDTYDLLPLVDYASQHTDFISCEWPEGARLTVRRRQSTAAWNGSIRKNDNGWFEIEGTVELDQGKVVTMAQLLDLVNQSHGRFIRLDDEEFLELSDSLRRQLEQISTIASRSHGHLQMSPFSAALLGEDIMNSELVLHEDEELRAIRQRIRESGHYSPAVPATLNATLRNYQKEGFRWMARLNQWGAGALLADDMGLGKTVQTLAFLLPTAAAGPSLVVAPASVAPNWLTEFEKFAPSLRVTMLNFAPDRRAAVAGAGANDVVVTTYGLLLSVQDFVTTKQWTTICLDEAHIIKNRGAKTSAVAMQLKSDNRVMLTGTPVQNHLGELWNLFQFVNPGLLGTFEDFNRRFIIPIEQNGDKQRQKSLDRLVKPFMLRRTKDKVAKELPEKQEIFQRVTLSEEERLVYEVLRRRAETLLVAEGGGTVSMNTLAEITRLRMCSCDTRLVEEGRAGGDKAGSKTVALVELLQTIIESFTTSTSDEAQGGALVFSQFTSYLALIKQALETNNIPYLYIDGSVDIKTRQRLVDEFQAGHCPVFLISLKAGGLGLNLTRANYVIHMDPWWNPAIEAQATDRAHRIGQKRTVTVYHLIAEGTIEEKIQRMHERKQALVRDVLDSTDTSHRLTGEELLAMVSG